MADEENGTFSGQVLDVAGKPVAGVQIFVYRNTNIRRPADFLSAATDSEGEFSMTLPPGEYWTLARLRRGKEQFGPLLPGDKHSGAPLEIEIAAGEKLEEDFIVADLEETSLLEKKYDTSFQRIKGVLLDRQGQPVDGAYAFANRKEGAKRIPDYVSAWTDSNGEYILFLPPGTYFFGIGREFPPSAAAVPRQKETIDSSGKNINIILKE